MGLKGKQKLADIWGKNPYIVKSQPVPNILVYEVQEENSRAKRKLLHRNMLLPFCGMPVPQEPKTPKQIQLRNVISSDDAYQADSSSSSQEERVDELELTVPRYKIPQRRNQKSDKQMESDSSSNGNLTETEVTHKDVWPRKVLQETTVGKIQENSNQNLVLNRQLMFL